MKRKKIQNRGKSEQKKKAKEEERERLRKKDAVFKNHNQYDTRFTAIRKSVVEDQ